MTSKKHFHTNAQTIVAVLALFISVSASFFSWQQVDVSRIHNRLSIKPIVHITPYAEGKGGRNGLYVSNFGLGPAIIKEFSVKSAHIIANGFESDRWPELLVAAEIDPSCFATGWPKLDSVVKAGDELPLLVLTRRDGSDLCYAQMIKLIGGDGIDVEVRYESIYGDAKIITERSKVNSRTIQRAYDGLFGKM